MNCAEARELLPWLGNGTLSQDQELALREHLDGCVGCQAEEAEARLAGGLFASHAEPAALVTLAFADGSTGDDEVIAAHLAHCARCRDELEMARRSRGAMEAETSATAPAGAPRRFIATTALAAGIALCAVAGWFWAAQEATRERAAAERREATLRDELDRLRESTRQPAPTPEAAAPGDVSRDSEAAALERVAGLEREMARLRAPRAGVPIVEAMADDFVLRAPAREPVRVRTDQGAVLVLLVETVARGETFRVRIQRRSRVVFDVAAPALVAGELNLHLPAGALPPGSYELLVLTSEGRRIGSFGLEVR